MSKACKNCKGRGRWQEVAEQADSGETEIMAWMECNDCHGTGIEQDPEAGDDYDIGGDSYADED